MEGCAEVCVGFLIRKWERGKRIEPGEGLVLRIFNAYEKGIRGMAFE